MRRGRQGGSASLTARCRIMSSQARRASSWSGIEKMIQSGTISWRFPERISYWFTSAILWCVGCKSGLPEIQRRRWCGLPRRFCEAEENSGSERKAPMKIGAMNHPARNPLEEIEWIGKDGFDFVDFPLEPTAADPDKID